MFHLEFLSIQELLDIDMKKFERDNNMRLSYVLNSLFGKNESAKKNSVEKSAEKDTSRSKSKSMDKLKVKKVKVSDVHLNVGLGKRIDPFDEEDRREARNKWEKINIKKDHLKKFTEKDKRHRVL